MTREDIIRMARDAGMSSLSLIDIGYLERFHAMAVAAERETCAKLCDEQHDRARSMQGAVRSYACSEAIRARGQA